MKRRWFLLILIAAVAIASAAVLFYSVLNSETPCYACFFNNQPKSVVETLNSKLVEYKPLSDYGESDKRLILGRLNNDEKLVCSALEKKKSFLAQLSDAESRLALFEELYFLAEECGDSSAPRYLDEAIALSIELDKKWKTKLYSDLKAGNINRRVVETRTERRLTVPSNARKIVLGKSRIDVDSDTLIGSQVERFKRDWLSGEIRFFPLENNIQVDYMEGFLIGRIVSATQARVKPLPNSNLVKSSDWLDVFLGSWFATDEKGQPRFRVFDDKMQYPTTLCSGGVCVFKDTHGISALVSEALYNNVSLVVGCGDGEAKMLAAQYLAQKGVNVYFPTDRFVGEVIGYEGAGVLLGSAPVKTANGTAVIGGQIIEIDLKEKIVVEDTSNKHYPAQYYDAPARYFRELEKVSGVDLDLAVVNVEGAHETQKLVDEARKNGARVIGVKIQYEDEYEALKKWLSEDEENRAVLFHSVAYAPGFKLFSDFPNQTSFGDPQPVFE